MPLRVLSLGCAVMQMRLREMGVLQPTDVQREAIPKALTGTNVAIQCYTGSGKVRVLLVSWHRHESLAAMSVLLQHADVTLLSSSHT